MSVYGNEASPVLLKEEAQANLRSFPSWEHSTWVYPSKSLSTHLDPCNFYGPVFLPAVKAAKLERVTWHTLRHTFASRLAMNGHGDKYHRSLALAYRDCFGPTVRSLLPYPSEWCRGRRIWLWKEI